MSESTTRRGSGREDASTIGAGRGSDPLPAGAVAVRIVQDGVVTSRVLVPGAATIGRSSDCDVFVADPSMSRRHAVIRIGASVEVEDLGSANGTRVGGRVLRAGERAVVQGGSVVELGGVMFVFGAGASRAPDEDAGSPRRPHGEPAAHAMDQVRRLVERVASSNISVILEGETGVGKEVTAETIHRLSPRARRRFVRLNSAAFSEALLESELFGYEKGAFSGADRAKPGLLETADGSTLLFDEIGELPLTLQAKLLRVVEERAVMRVGGLAPRPVDVRFIAATNRDLEREVAEGRFRSDLYHRLDGVTIRIPPLRERREEILSLARSFIDAASQQLGKPAPTLSPRAGDLLRAHPWPGNVRELRNVIDRAVVLCAGAQIAPEHLPLEKWQRRSELHSEPSPPLRPPERVPPAAPSSTPEELRRQLLDAERERVLSALESCAGNQTRAAKLLGMSRNTLAARLEAFQMPRPRKRT